MYVMADTAGAVQKSGPELIVIDYRVQDADTLLSELLNTDRDFRILRLDSDTDGISQITEKLEQVGNVSAIHLLTHGRDGEILLGSTRLNASTLAQHAPELLAWQHSLTSGADLLLYGCDVAETVEGRDFVDSHTHQVKQYSSNSGSRSSCKVPGAVFRFVSRQPARAWRQNRSSRMVKSPPEDNKLAISLAIWRTSFAVLARLTLSAGDHVAATVNQCWIKAAHKRAQNRVIFTMSVLPSSSSIFP